MQIKDVEKLKAWLLKRLSPLCDADPSALSKYIVALLRKEKPRSALKELCINQLEVFLSKETPLFVDRLFLSLDTESYLTGTNEDSPVNTHNVQAKTTTPPLKAGSDGGGGKGTGDRVVTDHRRQMEDTRHREVDEDDRDFRRARSRHDSPVLTGGDQMGGDRGQRKRKTEGEPPKRLIRQRLGPKEEDYRNNRRPHPRRRSQSRSRSRSKSRSSTPEFPLTNQEGEVTGRKRPHADQKQQGVSKRQRCKDYDERGMCLLGEQCPFDHGVDPVVITGPIHPPYAPPPPFPMNIPPPPPPSLPNPSNGLMMPSVMPPPPLPPMTVATTSVVDGYNPEEPSLNATSKVIPPPPPPPIHPSMLAMRPNFPPMPGIPGLGMPPPLPPSIPHPPHCLGNNFNSIMTTTPTVSVGATKTPFKLSDTLLLRKIPRELNTITKLSGHFEKFGTIVNLQVRYENDPESAIVQFTSPQEAKKAHDATEAVLNNRFIKVYYLKNTGGHKENAFKIVVRTPGEVALNTIRPVTTQQTTTAISTTHLIHPTTPITSQAPPTQPYTPVPSTVNRHHHHTTTTNAAHIKRQAAAVIKQEAINTAVLKRMELQKKSQLLLEAQIQQQKLLLSKLEKCGNSLSTEEKSKVLETLKSLSSSIAKFKETIASATKTAAVKPYPQKPRHGSIADPNSPLQQTADHLRNEARHLGILPSKDFGGGVAQNRSPPTEDGADLRNKLDSKPRQLLVINSVTDKDLLVKYFESFGGLNQVEIDPDSNKNLIFTFRNRTVAEKAVQGSIFKGKPLIMKWYTPKPTITTPTENLVTRTVTINEGDEQRTTTTTTTPPTALPVSNELDPDGLLKKQDSVSSIDVVTPNQSKPRVVHLLDDDDEDEERSWRR